MDDAHNEFARAIVETLHEPLLVLSPQLLVKSANRAFHEEFEVEQAETIGRKIYDLGNGQWDIPALRTLLEEVLPENSVFNDFEVEHHFESIGYRIMLVNARRLNHSQLILLGIRDVTDSNMAYRALRDSRQRLESIYASARVGISEVTADGRLVRVNDELCRILGRTREELLNSYTAELTHPDDRARCLEVMGGLFQTGTPFSLDKRYLRPDGSLVHASSAASLLDDSDPPTMVVITTDLTERRRADAATRASEAQYQTLFNSIDEGFCVIEMIFDESGAAIDYQFIEVNPAFERHTGLADAKGKRVSTLVPDLEPLWAERYGRVAKTGNALRFVERSDAMDRWFDVYAFRPSDAGADRVAILFNDVTERTRAEEALRVSEQRFRMIADNMAQLAWTCDDFCEVNWYNKRWMDYTGLTFEEMRDWGWKRVHHPDHVDRVVQGVERARDSGEAWEDTFPLRGKDGQYRWFLSRAYPIRDENGDIVQWFGTNTDITELREAEAARHLSEQRYRVLVESAREYAMLMIDPDGTIVSWSAGAERLFGYTADEMIGEPSETLYTEEDRAAGAARRKRQRAMREGQATTDQWYRRKDGSLFWANGVLRQLENGNPKGFIKILRDQTKQKAHEEQLKTVMAELNHRVKNTLAVVQSIATQTMRRAATLESFRPDFEKRLRSIAKAHSLLTRTSWTGVTLADIIESELGAAPDDARVTASGPDVTLPPGMTLALHMVLHELATNAHKYGCLATDDGSLSIRWKVRGQADARELELGWTERCAKPVHQPGDEGFGTRLIEQLVRYELKGELERDFEPCGMRFRLRVPVASGAIALNLDGLAQTDEPEAPDDANTPAGPSILLVEDMAPLAMAMKDELEYRGFKVIGPAPTVAKARALVMRTTPGVAVLDVNLGDEQVFPLIPELREAGVPIVLLTGHDAASIPGEYADLPLMSKPVELDHLERLLRQQPT